MLFKSHGLVCVENQENSDIFYKKKHFFYPKEEHPIKAKGQRVFFQYHRVSYISA